MPLASGLLSGRYTRDTTFAPDDHRSYNAHGEAFDVGETFSGVGLEGRRRRRGGVRSHHRGIAGPGRSGPGRSGPGRPGSWAPAQWALARSRSGSWAPAQWALRWVIQQPGVTTVIPGARSTGQARQNAEAASLPPLPQAELDAIEGLYDKYFRATVHDRW